MEPFRALEHFKRSFKQMVIQDLSRQQPNPNASTSSVAGTQSKNLNGKNT